jgi:PKD repeat protein
MKRRWDKVFVSITLLLALLVLVMPAVPALAVVSAGIWLDPTPRNVIAGQPFTVTLKIDNVPGPGMAGYDFKITYDKNVINFSTNQSAHEWLDPTYGTPFAFNVRNDLGYISFNDYYTGTPAPSGNLTLVRLHGTAVAAGTGSTALHFDKADIIYPDASPISETVTDGLVNVWLAPVANFTWGYTDVNGSGTLDAGEQIQFTDTSSNGPTGWNWNFGDGNNSTAQNATHSYNVAGTHTVSLTASNFGGSNSCSQNITVQPNSVNSVVVSPGLAKVKVGSSVIFSATGYDVYGNPIAGVGWTWEVTNSTAGTINATTGMFTAGSTPGTYPGTVKATGAYKGATKSGYADVEVVTVLAEVGISKGLDASGQAQVDASINRVFDPGTLNTTVVDKGIAGYAAQFTYNGTQINILNVSGGNYPFDDIPTFTIDNGAGLTTFAAVQTKAEPQPPITVSYMPIRLVGNATENATLVLSFTQITDGNGSPIPEKAPLPTETFLRGDANADGSVSISDVLRICQYVVGLVTVGQGLGQVHPINAACVRHDGTTGDKITISDALYVAQYLVGLRDANFNFVS